MQHQILSKHLRRHLIFGANTDVGKTIVSAGLVRAASAEQSKKSTFYLKPLQTGVSDESTGDGDADFVKRVVLDSKRLNCSSNLLHCQTLFKWNAPVSPHLASRNESKPVSDNDVLSSVQQALSEYHGTTIVETAGGALSPSSCSPLNQAPFHAHGTSSSWGWSTQADLYKHLRLPAILVGDGRLGGIACTLSTLESLIVRGYDIHTIILIDDEEQDGGRESNAVAIREYLAR